MNRPNLLTLPDDRVGDTQRTRWSLAELVAHWVTQGERPVDILLLVWDRLERSERPEGLTIIPDRSSGVPFRSDHISPEGVVALRGMGVDRRDVAHRLYLTRGLVSWVIDQLIGDIQTHQSTAPGTIWNLSDATDGPPAVKKQRQPSKCFDFEDQPIIAEMRDLICASKGRISPAEAVRKIAKNRTLAGSEGSAEKRIARKYWQRYRRQIEV